MPPSIFTKLAIDYQQQVDTPTVDSVFDPCYLLIYAVLYFTVMLLNLRKKGKQVMNGTESWYKMNAQQVRFLKRLLYVYHM